MPLERRRLDLHVHTPASHDFNDKTLPLSRIVERAMEVGLDAIAVTDHNCVDSIDAIKAEAAARHFVVFPGFEISCHGAESGSIHVIGLFDPATSQEALTRVLGALGIRGTGADSLTMKSVDDVVNIIRGFGGLPVLAHANSTHGALSDIRGNPRIELIRNPKLSAVEATAGDFAKRPGSRLVDRLNGSDPQYRRKLAVYRASDNRVTDGAGHCVESIGSSYTVFYMGELTLEALRQCFADPDARVIQSDDVERLQGPGAGIRSIAVKKGFLDGLDVALSPGMNSIIGGTGTGKSLLVEFLRFALGRPPHDRLLKEHKDKLDKQLGNGGSVTIRFVDGSGEEYELTRVYHRRTDTSTVSCRNLSTGEEFVGDIGSIFPILAYSQNEILEVTRDARAQLDLLDNFRQFERLSRERATLTSELRSLDRRLVEAHSRAEQLPVLRRDLATIRAKIKKCEASLRGKVSREFGSFRRLEKAREGAYAALAAFDALSERLTELDTFLTAGPDLDADAVSAAPGSLIKAQLRQSYNRVREALRSAADSLTGDRARAVKAIKEWERQRKYTASEKRYAKALEAREKAALVETDRQQFIKERDKVAKRLAEAEAAAATTKEVRKLRRVALDKLAAVRGASYAEREQQAQAITQRSEEKLKIVVTQASNREQYLEDLARLKVGSLAEEAEVQRLVNKLTVVDFVEMVLDRKVGELSRTVELTEAKAANVIDVLLKPEKLTDTLALQYESGPEDTVEILYRKQDGRHYPLSELSMGQRADALMLIALGDSQMPVIIDQPEDALDISSIWDDVCKRLRVSKHKRQFLFTTHNSSIAVAADSDEFHVMDADATRGWVARSGSIDQEAVKGDVITHLEGGADSYDLKRRKYNL